MIVTCPRCLTKFNLPDENLNPGIEVNLRCSRCKEEFRFAPQGDSSVIEDAIDPLSAFDEPDATTDFTENDQSESPAAAAADLSSDIEFDEDFEAIAESDTDDSDPIETVAEDEFDVNELFVSSEVAAGDEPEVADDGPAAVDEDAIFELSDDFDSDGVDFNVVEEPAAEDTADSDEKDDNNVGDSAIEDLALDIDDIDLGDIEFDSLEDDSATAAAGAGQSAKPTQIDADDDFAGLLDPGAAAEVVVAEPAVLSKSDEKSVSGQKSKPAPEGNQKRTLIMVLACFLVLSLALWAGYGLWQRFSVNMAKHLQLQEISNQRLRLPSDRVVIVLRGKLVNSSPKMVTDLKIKGVLVDKKGKVLAEVITSGGVSFSEEELDLLDSKKLAMLENSAVNLPPNGGELPFMIAFYDYPAAASECYVELSSFKVKKGRVR
jgi:hypothetical protein